MKRPLFSLCQVRLLSSEMILLVLSLWKKAYCKLASSMKSSYFTVMNRGKCTDSRSS